MKKSARSSSVVSATLPFGGQPLAFVDLETSGATAHHDRITEVGIVTVDPDGHVEEWSSLVNPGQRIPPFIESLTGISNAMVADARAFEDIADEVHRRLEGRLFIAHNVRFDYGFLKNEFGRVGLNFRPKMLCTAKLSRAIFPEHRKHNLDSLIERHSLTCTARHRALGDAQVLWQFAQIIQRDCDAVVLATAVGEQLKTPSLPPRLDPAVLDGIPDTPGVYLFYDERNVPLYVGKSINLRTRVLSHFSGDHSSGKEMRISLQLARLEWIETAGELGALLHEARLVKELLPVHNRMLRRSNDLCAYRWTPGAVTCQAPELVRAADIDPWQLGQTFGMFRSKKKAVEALQALADENGLCTRLLGLEKSGAGSANLPALRPCFAHQLKKCLGACCGKESVAAHNMRLLAAFGRLRMKSWPHKGLTGFRETRAAGPGEEPLSEMHLFDQWCYLGRVRSDEELHERLASRMDLVFDLDIYKIMTRFLEGKRKGGENGIDIVRLGRSTARQLALELEEPA
jgi:DNA polymerase-3 subunit epsilon